MNIWGWIIFIGIIFGPIIYLVLSVIGDSIQDRVKEGKRRKFYGTEEIINVSTYKSDITREELINFFLSQIICYRSYYFIIKYYIYKEPDKQNYAWKVSTNKEMFGWGDVYNIYFYFSNGWACFTTSKSQFSSGEKLSQKYYLHKHDFGSYEIDRVLTTCREEAIMTWKKHGRELNNNLPFDFLPVSTPYKSSNSSKRKTNNKQKEKSSYNENNSYTNTSDMLSFYRNLLGLKLQFTQTELKEAYRKAVAKYHPDRYGNSDPRSLENAEILIKQVNEAYECLKKAA